MTAVKVSLTAAELAHAARVGAARDRIHFGPGRAALPERRAFWHVQGAEAELAFSLATRLAWDGETFDRAAWLTWRKVGADVSGYEVRATAHPAGRLLIQNTDVDDSPYVLCRVHLRPVYLFVGWQTAGSGKQYGRWLVGPHNRPCWYVDNADLRPLSELPGDPFRLRAGKSSDEQS